MDILSTIERAFSLFFALIAAFGGWEAIKYLLNRKQNRRISEAEADSSEFDVLAKTNTFLEQQLQEKEERFAAQTDRLRKLTDELIEMQRVKAAVELELQTFRCCVKKCPKREPQNWYGFGEEDKDLNQNA